MTLRKKLYLLMTGIIAFPFLASGITVFISLQIFGMGRDSADFVRYAVWMQDTFHPAAGAGRAELPGPPDAIPFVFLSPASEVVLSNVEAFPRGKNLSLGTVVTGFEILAGGGEHNKIIIEKVRKDSQFAGTVVALVNDRLGSRMFNLRIWINTFYVLVSLVLGASVGSTFILRKLGRSVGTLEAAAQKISAGNFDFELVPQGEDELTTLTRSFETMRRKIRENSAQRARFLMAVSHDLKTPLTSIRGYIEALEDGMAGNEKAREKYLAIIRDKTEILEGRIFELIDFVRMETGDWRMRYTSFGLKAFLDEVSAVYGQDASVEKRLFTARVDIPPAVEVRGDKALLERVFENLFGNALRYSEENGKLELYAGLEAGDAVIRLSNTGKGIPPGELELVFEPFYRGSASRREAGFGLGLSTVRSILDSHGWTIHAESDPGVWTHFVVRIPLKE